jgi:hypothetical protein
MASSPQDPQLEQSTRMHKIQEKKVGFSIRDVKSVYTQSLKPKFAISPQFNV